MSQVDTIINLFFKTANMVIDTQKFALSTCNMLVKPMDRNPVNAMWKNAIAEDRVDVITYQNSQDAQDIRNN